MKILVKSSDEHVSLCFHCTKSEDAAQSIITYGFDTNLPECDATTDLYTAQGYGPICIACNLEEIYLLKLYPLNEERSFKIKDYPNDCQGVFEPVNLNPDELIFYIFDIASMNNKVKWFRYPKGDRE